MKILTLNTENTARRGPQRARKNKQRALEEEGQLNLFSGNIYKLEPKNPFEKGLLMEDQNKQEAAREFYLQAIENGDTVADAYCNLAIMEAGEGNVAKAVNYLTLCLKHAPRHYQAHYNLANVYAEAGNLDLARIHYEVAIEIEPSFPNSYFNLGLMLARSGRYEKAIKMLVAYTRLSPVEGHQDASSLIHRFESYLTD